MTTPVPFADLEDLIDFLRKTDIPGEADKLWMHLEGATEAVEGWNGIGPLVTREVTERVTATCGRFILTETPVQSVTTATRIGDGLELVGADLDLDKSAGIVRGLAVSIPSGYYDVVSQAGRGSSADVPTSLRLAVLIIAAHIWEIQRGPRSRNFHGQASADESGQHKAAAGYLIPNRAAHLMQPYASENVA